MISPLVLLSAVLATAAAQSVPATASAADLASVNLQYTNSGFAASTNTGFGVGLSGTALLTVAYPGFIVANGAPYTVAQVATLPTVYVTPATPAVGAYSAAAAYTLVLADAASLGDPDLQGNYRHYLANGLKGTAGTGGNTTFVPSGGTTITNYAAPGPIAGTGPHRYAWLLFTQGANFAAPADLSTSTPAGHWNVSSYVSTTGLTLVASSFFTVQNGQPTGSVVATSAPLTSAVSSGVASVSSRISSAVASATSAPSASSSSAAAAATTAAKSGSNKVVVGLVGMMVGIVVACVA